ncbi:MAG: hypothetical protein COA47_09385 [Robiginitomaculum sp.]|nr:MAG: hypothetical protein COA47_09385 [Robiginitomaculum sp.]
MNKNRLEYLRRFYAALLTLENKIGGPRLLSQATGRMQWPQKGIYFFFEENELRSHSGAGNKVVRIGTHGLTATSKTSLWHRLSQHRGSAKSGGGNHRGSILRLIVGTSLLKQDGDTHQTWGKGSSAPREIREKEQSLEKRVSTIIGAMPFLWLEIDHPTKGPNMRGMIERNSIALLSNYGRSSMDQASSSWLGHDCNREKVRGSNLWNSNHVTENYDPSFLDLLEQLVGGMRY